jgi:spore germination protein YaaH
MYKKTLFATSVVGVIALLFMTFFSLTDTKLVLVSAVDTPPSDTSTPTQVSEEENSAMEEDQGAAVIRSKKNQVNTATTSTSTPFTPSATAAQISDMRTMAWIYPGNPACGANAEIADGRKIHTLKAEFFTISGGFLTLLDTSNTRCNGYSPAYISLLKQYSTEQYATISSASVNDMASFFSVALAASSTEIDTLVNFVVDNNITGIELDFEDFSSWTQTDYSNYKTFVKKLGDALHAKGKKLMLDAPAVSNDTEEKWFLWRYSDFVNLPVDHMVIMAYDYQYDHGAGAPVAPLDWLKNVVTWTSTKYPKEKLTIGLPSYGYQGTLGSYRMTILTYEQIRKKTGFNTATRDPRSGEMTWRSGTTVYFYQDSQSLKQKRDLVASLGIKSISIWHLGGNQWF